MNTSTDPLVTDHAKLVGRVLRNAPKYLRSPQGVLGTSRPIPEHVWRGRAKAASVLSFASIALAALLFSGCSTVRVQPWERGALTGYSMRADRDPLASAMAEHTFFSREATGGGRSVGGSACGCN